jgi:hypothetical protein
MAERIGLNSFRKYATLDARHPKVPMLDPIFRKTLIRHYYFAEAMAVYELYYQPLVETYQPARN